MGNGNRDLNDALRLAFGVGGKSRASAAFWQQQHAARAGEAAHYLNILLELQGALASADLRNRAEVLSILADFLPHSGRGRPKDTWGTARRRWRKQRRATEKKQKAAERDRALVDAVAEQRKLGAFTDRAAVARLVDLKHPSAAQYRRDKVAAKIYRDLDKAKRRLRQRDIP